MRCSRQFTIKYYVTLLCSVLCMLINNFLDRLLSDSYVDALLRCAMLDVNLIYFCNFNVNVYRLNSV